MTAGSNAPLISIGRCDFCGAYRISNPSRCDASEFVVDDWEEPVSTVCNAGTGDLTVGLAIGCDNGDNPLCCDDRCTDASFDPENCGECGTDCLAIANANVCLEFVSCGGGTTPGECQFTLPCPAPAAGNYAVCTNSRFLCSEIYFPGTPEYDDCLAEPAVAVCEEFERQSDTLCVEGCNTNADCELDEICRSRCGGAPYADVLGCIDGTYCAETAGQCD